MTIEELYNYAKENGIEKYEIKVCNEMEEYYPLREVYVNEKDHEVEL